MPLPTPQARIEAIQSLFRIRGVDSGVDSEGLRTVWHQGAKGADLLSHIDAQGSLRRQEFSLLADHFLWREGVGLSTGEVIDESSSGFKASALVRPDPQMVPQRAYRAHAALCTYQGDDKYILHLKQVIALAVEGVEKRDAPVISRAVHSIAAPAPSRSPPGWIQWALVGLALAIALGLWWWRGR